VALLHKHGIAFHEKHKGQLFCDRSSEDIITLLLAECLSGGVERWQPCSLKAVSYSDCGSNAARYTLDTSSGTVTCKALVIATGGLSIPKIGATDLGYRIARQFDIPVVETRPALVPLTFDETTWAPFAQLSGLSLLVQIATGGKKDTTRFREDLLFTHRGLSGPGVLQISSYWKEGSNIRLNLAPDTDTAAFLQQAKTTSRKRIANELAALLPSRLAETWVAQCAPLGQAGDRPINEAPDKALDSLAERIARWELTPTGTEGYRKAEVTAGGVDTRALSGQTMESSQPGLYFIGEVVDLTGWLGGYNFQWAWASAFACAQGLAAKSEKRGG
jgi:predicted Rossmann fold flavoprotein